MEDAGHPPAREAACEQRECGEARGKHVQASRDGGGEQNKAWWRYNAWNAQRFTPACWLAGAWSPTRDHRLGASRTDVLLPAETTAEPLDDLLEKQPPFFWKKKSNIFSLNYLDEINIQAGCLVILDSPTSLLHQGSPSSWIFATKGVLKSPGEFLESSLKGLMVKISSFIKFLPLKLMLVENLR
jgi:hypothetical protein